jgi:hypothetical protein
LYTFIATALPVRTLQRQLAAAPVARLDLGKGQQRLPDADPAQALAGVELGSPISRPLSIGLPVTMAAGTNRGWLAAEANWSSLLPFQNLCSRDHFSCVQGGLRVLQPGVAHPGCPTVI